MHHSLCFLSLVVPSLLRFRWLVALGLWTTTPSIQAHFRLPQSYQSYKAASKPGERLENLIIAVNGVPRLVPAESTVTFIRGDKLVVREAYLRDRQKSIEAVNVIGIINPKQPDGADDRNLEIDTSTLLVGSDWMVDRENGLYVILASTKNMLHGKVFLQPLDPQLQYIDLTVNGQPRVVRAGENLVVKASDRFKVTAVATNIKDAANIHFNIVPMQEVPNELRTPQQASYYSIIFSHRDYAFATIPLRIE